MKWSQPRDINDWTNRLVGLRPFVLMLFVAIVLLSEFRFDWMEQVLGNALAKTNPDRPESGSIWEKGRSTQAAQQTLEQIVSDQSASRHEIRGAESFSDVADHILPGRGAMLAPDHFRKMYLALPAKTAREILSPHELLRIVSTGNWHRVYFEKSENGITAYLLDVQNRVLKQLEISGHLLHPGAPERSELEASLDAFPSFENRIYPSDLFLQVLDERPPDISRRVLPNPEFFLRLPGRMTRVGFSETPVSGFIEIGIEVDDSGRLSVMRQKGYEWAVWQLRSSMDKKLADADFHLRRQAESHMDRESP